MNPPVWQTPPRDLELLSRDVHVWRASLEQPSEVVKQLIEMVSDDERTRETRFRFGQDQRYSVVRRGILRTILGRYLGIDPSEIRFCYSPYGKPFLEQEISGGTLRFNLAYAHQLALFVFARGRDIGIDVEYVRSVPEADQIVEHFFSFQEKVLFHSLPSHVRQEAFLTWWTRKEAYIKAIGVGLSLPLDQFEVLSVSAQSPILLDYNGTWSLFDFVPEEDYVAAISIEREDWCLGYWQWHDYLVRTV